MSNLNHNISVRISKEADEFLTKFANETGFRKTDLIRHLLNRNIEQLKKDSIEAGGLGKLTFTLRK